MIRKGYVLVLRADGKKNKMKITFKRKKNIKNQMRYRYGNVQHTIWKGRTGILVQLILKLC